MRDSKTSITENRWPRKTPIAMMSPLRSLPAAFRPAVHPSANQAPGDPEVMQACESAQVLCLVAKSPTCCEIVSLLIPTQLPVKGCRWLDVST